ncbi:MAG TPA: dihydroneopterin aldolase, partial [Euryarchaeota archaeon]|nr:dihydroneopterin aldolase [Euryarchaeota archaeon]
IYHQFIGTPISTKNVDLLEKTIAEGTRIQPFVKDAEVHIDREKLRSKRGEFDYDSLSGEMLSVRLEIAYGGVQLTARMQNIPAIRYPLMYIERISRQE